MKYENCQQHLVDELQKLHLRIYAQVLKFRKAFDKYPDEAFKGLVLSDEEIDDILAGQRGFFEDGIDDSVGDEEVRDCLERTEWLEQRLTQKVAENLSEGVYLPLNHLVELFALTSFERDCLMICLAPELDLRYERLYAYLQDDVTKKRPTVNLILDLLCSSFAERLAARQVFSPESPLLQHHLLEAYDKTPERPSPLLARFLKLDDRMVDFILGRNSIDSRLVSFLRWGDTSTSWSDIGLGEDIQTRLSSLVERNSTRRDHEGFLEDCLILSFEGPSGVGKRATAAALCGQFGVSLLIVDVPRLLQSELHFGLAVDLVVREAIFSGATLYWDNFDLLLAEEHRTSSLYALAIESLKRFSGMTFLANCKTWEPVEILGDRRFVRVEFPVPSYPARKRLWEAYSDGAMDSELELDELASKFRLGAGQIRDAVVIARNLADWRDLKEGRVTSEDLSAACRARSNQGLNNLAQKIEPRYTWEDIVLPEDAVKQLQEMCSTVRHRGLVQDKWGFAQKLSLGRGVTALFAGPSGTGKTMAVEVVANELVLDLYKIDLSGVVSKYIGETEKNLERIFQTAEDSNAILFFDEADALFGKRSEVRDSHDRYANIEISYLLQKMEAYDGVAILASNMRQYMDEAFVRRLAFSVLFPFPNEIHRRRIWETIWPPETPRASDLDLDFVSKQFKLSGGNIKNIALAAAFLAVSDGGVVTMESLLQATRREFQKMGKTLTEDELGVQRG